MQFPIKLKKIRRRRLLIISATHISGGIQGIYVEAGKASWEILSSAYIPYSQKAMQAISMLREAGKDAGSPFPVIARADLALTHCYEQCIRACLMQVKHGDAVPHCIGLHKLQLWQGPVEEEEQIVAWNVSCGDAQYLASRFNAPVYTDFIRQDCLTGGRGRLPTCPGDSLVVPLEQGPACLVNIGVRSHVTMVEQRGQRPVIDDVAGPGAQLIDIVARGCGCEEGFDRDGQVALQGTVDTDCIQHMLKLPPCADPSALSREDLQALAEEPALTRLDRRDRMATITGLVARNIFDFCRRHAGKSEPATVWLSGGGALNLALIEYLKTYFDPVPVKSVEELGIPPAMRVPLAMALTLNTYLDSGGIPRETGSNPHVCGPGRWLFP